MATVFMKWLETSPHTYDRGIHIITLGRLRRLKEAIVSRYAREGVRVLEIGCGTGMLTAMMAESGALVTAIDASADMLAEAIKKVAAANLEERVMLHHMDATLIGERFAPESFDLIASTLVFSELPPDEQRYVLGACIELLAPGGQLLIADEVLPLGALERMAYYAVRLPVALVTWMLTRATTSALWGFEQTLTEAGFSAQRPLSYLNGSLVLFEAVPAEEAVVEAVELHTSVVGRLRHRVSPGTLLKDLLLLFWRIVPPYPKVRPGLYTVGHPDEDSPVLVTGNFDLTVRRVVKEIDGHVDSWLLVADSSGINVWCAAGGGYFTAEKVVAAIKSSRVAQVVKHHALILPQLCANGVDGWKVRQETGWGIHWGPSRAADIPAYLAARRKKTDSMRWVDFPLKDRLEMVTVTMGFYALLILVPVLIFWRDLFWPVAASLVGLSYFYAIFHPWLPGRDGLLKSLPLTLIALAGLFVFTFMCDPVPAPDLFKRVIGITALSIFTAGELQGMSPLMRGEQANWGWEAAIAGVLGLTYWLMPLALGWR